MPRQARVVFSGIPHHVTQRGNHRREVFFQRSEGLAYLRLLRERTERHAIDVAAYCLMPNHVHLVLVPATADALHRTLKVVHGRFAQRINRMRNRTGHLWQNRYYSAPLDPPHYLNAVRYVELNPVRAGMVDCAPSYEWSSAAAHCGLRSDPLVEGRPRSELFGDIVDWAAWLSAGLDAATMDAIRRHTRQNLPCGAPAFLDQLERIAGRTLRYRPHGRPADPEEEDGVGEPFTRKR
jgi:putative transposase